MKIINNLLVKLAVFSVVEGQLKIFLPGRKLPFEKIAGDKLLDDVALDIYKKKIRLSFKNNYLEQLYTFSSSAPKGYVIEIVYYMLLPSYRIINNNLSDWLKVRNLMRNVDDYKIVSYALQRLRWKIEYTNVVYSLLFPEFTLSELQTVYEAILNKALDKRNFRKKILSLGLLQNTGKKRKGYPARPAEIYKFKTTKPQIVKVF